MRDPIYSSLSKGGLTRYEQPMPLWMISYVSVAVAPAAQIDVVIADICAVAQRVNAELDVTGVLTFSGGRFMQVIEGPKPSLYIVMQGIERDVRHHSLRVISDRQIAARRYPDWRMQYRTPEDFSRDQMAMVKDLAALIGSVGNGSIH